MDQTHMMCWLISKTKAKEVKYIEDEAADFVCSFSVDDSNRTVVQSGQGVSNDATGFDAEPVDLFFTGCVSGAYG